MHRPANILYWLLVILWLVYRKWKLLINFSTASALNRLCNFKKYWTECIIWLKNLSITAKRTPTKPAVIMMPTTPSGKNHYVPAENKYQHNQAVKRTLVFGETLRPCPKCGWTAKVSVISITDTTGFLFAQSSGGKELLYYLCPRHSIQRNCKAIESAPVPCYYHPFLFLSLPSARVPDWMKVSGLTWSKLKLFPWPPIET